MTTDNELRDLLTTEADGPIQPSRNWDDIVRRGHHHRRVRRTRRGLAAGALAAAVTIGGFALLDNSPDHDRDDVIVDQPRTAAKAPPGFGPWLTAARAHGSTLTVITLGSDPSSGWDPCTGYRPKVIETATRVVVQLVESGDPEARPWGSCQASEDDVSAGAAFDGAAWGSIELAAPLGDRQLVDGFTDQEVRVNDASPLLFPTALPEPLRVDRWSQEGEGCGMYCYSGGWTLSFAAGDLGLAVTAERPEEGQPQQLCRSPDEVPHPGGGLRPLAESVAVRGTTGALCSPVDGTYYLSFVEDGVTYGLSLGHIGDAGPGAPFSEADIIAIAEGLEPFEG